MLGILLSYWGGLFSGAMLDFLGVPSLQDSGRLARPCLSMCPRSGGACNISSHDELLKSGENGGFCWVKKECPRSPGKLTITNVSTEKGTVLKRTFHWTQPANLRGYVSCQGCILRWVCVQNSITKSLMYFSPDPGITVNKWFGGWGWE